MDKHPEVASVPPAQLGGLLRMARAAAGFTQDDAAKHIGVARTTLTAIEKGERRIQPGELVKLAKLFGRRVSDFVRPRAMETASFDVQFRRIRGKPAEEFRIALEAASSLEERARNYQELMEICGEQEEINYPAAYELEESFIRPRQRGEDVAASERLRLGIGDGPIGDLKRLLEEAVGIRVFVFSMHSSIGGIFACNDVWGAYIGANSRHPSGRRYGSVAHEYGHFLSTRYLPDVDLLDGAWGKSAAEQFADSFASNFLMPRSGVNRMFSEVKRQQENDFRLEDLIRLSTYFCVSVQAMCLRLEELGRVSAGTWEKLKERGLRPMEVKRTLGIADPPRLPEQNFPARYLSYAKRAFDKAELSEGQFTRFLYADRVSARDIANRMDCRVDKQADGDLVSLELDPAMEL